MKAYALWYADELDNLPNPAGGDPVRFWELTRRIPVAPNLQYAGVQEFEPRLEPHSPTHYIPDNLTYYCPECGVVWAQRYISYEGRKPAFRHVPRSCVAHARFARNAAMIHPRYNDYRLRASLTPTLFKRDILVLANALETLPL